ncbi:MAG: DNA polymerase Y family protein [Campylobacterales bacterium]
MLIHLDLDCFFVSCERQKHPFLNNHPVIVCNSSDEAIFDKAPLKNVSQIQRSGAFAPNELYDKFQSIKACELQEGESFVHTSILKGCECLFCRQSREVFYDEQGEFFRGMVVAKSYEAKDRGIKTATRLYEALAMCPEAVVIPQSHHSYYLISHKLKEFLESKIPEIEQYSIDEFFGNLKGWVRDEDTEEFLKRLQKEIKKKFSLPVSIGASSGKWIAKLATNFAKPYGIKVVPKDRIEDFIKNIDIEMFPGIGKAYTRRLHSRGIKKLGEIKDAKSLLYSWGKYGRDLYAKIEGSDGEGCLKASSRQSVGISRMFEPVSSRDEMLRRISILASHLSYTVMTLGLNPTTFYMKLKYSSDQRSKRSVTLDESFSESFYIKLCKEEFKKLDVYRDDIYGIVLSVSNFTQNHKKPLSLLNWEKDKKTQKAELAIKSLRDKYGVGVIGYGS